MDGAPDRLWLDVRGQLQRQKQSLRDDKQRKD